MLARLDATLLREVFSWTSLPDVIRVSVASYGMNQIVFAAINIRSSEGRTWWQALLERDYGDTLGDALLPNQKYMCYFGDVVDRVRFALESDCPGILEVLGSDESRIIFAGDEDDLTHAEDVVWMLDLDDARVDNIVWRMLKSDTSTYPRLPLPVYSLVARGRIDMSERLLQLPFITPAVKQATLESLVMAYRMYPSPGLLQLFSREMIRESEQALYVLMFSCTQLSVPDLLRVVLNAVPKDGKGKIRDSWINRNQGMPLQIAAKQGNVEVVRLLIKAGASPYTYKHAAFATAAKYKHTAVMKVLSQYLSKSNPAVVSHFSEAGMNKEGKALLETLKAAGKLKYGEHILVK